MMTRGALRSLGHTARLAFNWRVIAAAVDESTPVFERLRFVAISGRNLVGRCRLTLSKPTLNCLELSA
jgi:hypothetical protein